MTLRIMTLTTLVAVGSLLAGCGSSANAICEKRQQCFDDDLDIDQCAEDIDAWVDDEDTDDREERVDECGECIDDRTCAQVLESCVDDCFNIP